MSGIVTEVRFPGKPSGTVVTANSQRPLVLTLANIAVKGDKGDPGEKGEKGDKGDPGLPGSPGAGGDANLRHDQMSASDNWLITHNLGKYPSVTVIDSAGDGCEGHVVYVDTNTLRVEFTAAFSGVAYLN